VIFNNTIIKRLLVIVFSISIISSFASASPKPEKVAKSFINQVIKSKYNDLYQ
jgi:hypothetical protein